MEKSLDQLIEHLLAEIALCGHSGMFFPVFRVWNRAFHQRQRPVRLWSNVRANGISTALGRMLDAMMSFPGRCTH
jgi:hypothetical protein